jgi:hypothetical protein
MQTFEQAKEIAVREIERLTSKPPLCDYEFGEMWFKRERATRFHFKVVDHKFHSTSETSYGSS